MYIITPRDHISHDLSYFSGPKTSGAGDTCKKITLVCINIPSVILFTLHLQTELSLCLCLKRGKECSSHDKSDIHLTDLHNMACSRASVMGYAVKSL